jgi:hypothetical protein
LHSWREADFSVPIRGSQSKLLPDSRQTSQRQTSQNAVYQAQCAEDESLHLELSKVYKVLISAVKFETPAEIFLTELEAQPWKFLLIG